MTMETSCAGARHNMPPPLQVDLWPFDLESGVRVTCDVAYLCANFSLPRPLRSRLRPDVRDRQTDVRRSSSLA